MTLARFANVRLRLTSAPGGVMDTTYKYEPSLLIRTRYPKNNVAQPAALEFIT